MTRARKFGTFSGVFTPSILTILGVIMYLRLPSIVGQAGLLATIAIIGVAHVISVTTGLSVASVATDKKVLGGGTYYMLSRSLGLPIGGTIGIALFVGLSFAVSLYIIGFAESFLGFWGIAATIDAIRLTGGIVLVLVTFVTLVSTSLALRAQFFILAAIALSLLSILIGVGRHDLGPAPLAEPALDPLPLAAPFIVLFGIFFPAVTGFEAGVSMSGDLRDPKRSIPAGTIAAIAVGLVVYVGLAALLAYTVDATQLATNPNVLLDISLAPPLVLAGVWGATVSSALGSVLAAPRILQAVSADRITPAFFGRGYGRDNEPRHALLLTFVIAGAGIMIGELDVIARVVSMFFITAYGFLNLACVIESWASPDFRPTFRVPRVIPVVGALACLIVMIQLDIVAMAGATLLLGGLYLYLTRKQLQLESGDAWSGFWAAVARAALHRLDRGGEHRRNWRPNVLAFTLPGAPRDALLTMGRALAGRRGMLTAVEVVEGRAGRDPVLRPAPRAVQRDEYGVFTREVESADPYGCVEDIARFHGFAGIEPNALLLPWPAAPDARFDALLESVGRIDQNVLLFAPSTSPPGRKPQLDVWWWGEPAAAQLQLTLVRALASDDPWRGARVRLLTAVEPDDGAGVGLERRMAAQLEAMRIDADVHVVRDGVRGRPLDDVVAADSAGADLVILDAAPWRRQPRSLDVRRADALRRRLQATLFTLPSAAFSGAPPQPAPRGAPRPQPVQATEPVRARSAAPLRLPADPVLADCVKRVHAALGRAVEQCMNGPLREAYGRSASFIEQAHARIDEALEQAEAAGATGRTRAARTARKLYGDLLFQSQRLLAAQRQDEVAEQAAALRDFADRMLQALDALPEAFESSLPVVRDRALFRVEPEDDARLRAYKLYRRTRTLRGSGVRAEVPLRALLQRRLLDAVPAVERSGRAFAADAAAAAADVQLLLAAGRTVLARMRDEGDLAAASTERARIAAEAAAILERHRDAMRRVRADAERGIRQVAHRLARDLERVDAARRARITGDERREAAAAAERARALPRSWQECQTLLLAGAELELTLQALANRVATIVGRASERLQLRIQNGMVARLRAVHDALDDYIAESAADPDAEFTRTFDRWPELDPAAIVEELMLELREATTELPERVETLSPSAATRLAAGGLDDPEVVTIALRPLVDFHLDAELLGPVQQFLARAPAVYARAADAGQDAIRLTAFRLRDPDLDESDNGGPPLLLGDALGRIDVAIAEVEELADEFRRQLDRQLAHAAEGLEPYRMLRETHRLPQYIRARRGREAISWFNARRRQLQRFTGEQTVRLLYQRSEAARFARELEGRARRGDAALLELVAAVTPDPRTLEALPYHYRQLFLGKPGFNRDLWAGWATERRDAARAVEHYRRGFEGPLLVTGPPFAGTSSLAQAIIDDHFEGAPLLRVTPPRSRQTHADALRARIAAAAGAPAAVEDPLLAVPAGGVVLLEDLDRWWERGPEGYGAIDAAFDLMERHAGRCMFVVTANAHAFRFIDRVRHLRRRFLAVIECRPFSAREIGDVIQLRHGTTGLVYEVEGVREDAMTDIARARLFHRFYEYAGGSIGAALHGWIAHIEAVDGEVLRMRRPAMTDLQAIDALEPVSKLLLTQLVLHRTLPDQRLLQLGGAGAEPLAAPLAELRRTRVVLEDSRAELAINPYLLPFVARRLADLGFIE
jgi:amino acid transporter